MPKEQSTKPWFYNLKVEADVEAKIKEEFESNPNGSEYGKIINNRLRKAYNIKKKVVKKK